MCLTVKDTTRGPLIWEAKTARVHLVDASGSRSRFPRTGSTGWSWPATRKPTRSNISSATQRHTETNADKENANGKSGAAVVGSNFAL